MKSPGPIASSQSAQLAGCSKALRGMGARCKGLQVLGWSPQTLSALRGEARWHDLAGRLRERVRGKGAAQAHHLLVEVRQVFNLDDHLAVFVEAQQPPMLLYRHRKRRRVHAHEILWQGAKTRCCNNLRLHVAYPLDQARQACEEMLTDGHMGKSG